MTETQLTETQLTETQLTETQLTETQLTETVRKRWCEVLEAPSAGADDDFFRSGGHSLLAVRLTNSLREDLGVRIPVSAIFETSTLQGYAGRVADLVANA